MIIMDYKRKKSTRHRGSKTHGYGAKKKHRGAGSRGGRGKAGSGKRGDAKKPSFSDKKYFGKYGFKLRRKKEKIVNIKELEQSAAKINDKGIFVIDLKKEGFDKLLGTGTVTRKYKISVKSASPKALEKIKSKGGEVIFFEKAEKTSEKDGDI